MSKHTYPPTFGPGSHLWATLSWAILDQVAPGAIPERARFYLAGLIAGGMSEVYRMGKDSDYTINPEGTSITCNRCGMESFNSNDVLASIAASVTCSTAIIGRYERPG